LRFASVASTLRQSKLDALHAALCTRRTHSSLSLILRNFESSLLLVKNIRTCQCQRTIATMNCKFASLVFLSLVPANSAFAQVRVTVPSPEVQIHEKIVARIQNQGTKPVTFCVEFGQTSSDGTDTDPTPSPFIVQQKSAGKWSTLLIGPDVGSNRSPVTLAPGESSEFPIRLSSVGHTKLQVFYWLGSEPNLACNKPAKKPKKAESQVFTVR